MITIENENFIKEYVGRYSPTWIAKKLQLPRKKVINKIKELDLMHLEIRRKKGCNVILNTRRLEE